MSKRTEQLERQLKGQLMQRDGEAPEVAPMAALLEQAKTARVKAVTNSKGDILIDNRRAQIPGINGTINLRALLPELLDQDGRVYRVPNAEDAGRKESLSVNLARNSRAMEAGAILIPFPVTGETVTSGGVVGFRNEPSEFITIEPAPINAQTLDVNGEATVTTSPVPVESAKLNRDTLTQRSVSFKITRAEQKAKTDEELSAQIMQSLALGIGQAIDDELLNAITAETLNTYSLANAAAMGVKFEELRGIVGTSATGATTDQGQLFANGVPAEFSPKIASTVIGAFNRSAIAISDEITLLIKRTNAKGDKEIEAWLDVQALVPNAAKYFLAGV